MAYSNPVVGFTKLFSTIIHSTVWREEMHIKVVWVTMLAMADRNGRVHSSMPGLADASRVTLEQCKEALSHLLAPDPHSRTKEHEGRRIEEIDGGWLLLNYLKYREFRDIEERRLQVRQAVQRYRQKKATVSQGKPRKPKKAQAEAEAEAEAENRVREKEVRPRANALLGSRVEAELEAESLVRSIAAKDPDNLDPTEVISRASAWKGSGLVNPASMGDDRLAQTLIKLRSWLRRLDGTPEPQGPMSVVPSQPKESPEWEWINSYGGKAEVVAMLLRFDGSDARRAELERIGAPPMVLAALSSALHYAAKASVP